MSALVHIDWPAHDAATGDPLDGVACLTIDRPTVLNALDRATMTSLTEALDALAGDRACRCIVITGAGTRAFAAGADIREMVDRTAAEVLEDDFLAPWDRVARIACPTIAAVRGFCLGGGLELALACDVIIAADDAVLGFPEVTLGIIPGAGGTQRLTRIVGRPRAMDMVLTGRRISAHEAERWGLVSRVVAPDSLLGEALGLARTIAHLPATAVHAAMGAIDTALETALSVGIAEERRRFAGLFDTPDQKEGMRAFLERRPPRWTGD